MNSQTEIVSVKLVDGTFINVEVTPLGEQDVGSTKGRSLKEITTVIEGIALEVAEALQDIKAATKPDKVSIKLGIEVAIESGQLTALIVKGSSKANFELMMEWNNENENVKQST